MHTTGNTHNGRLEFAIKKKKDSKEKKKEKDNFKKTLQFS